MQAGLNNLERFPAGESGHSGPMTCSIIIPTIRQAEVLKVTLDSLAAQSEENFEVIVVCDGEDPRTRALSKSYSANYPLNWVFFSENRGLPSARNAGVLAAEGEILLFLDDDTSAAHDLVHQHRRHHEPRSAERDLVVYGSLVYLYSREPHTHTERLLRMDGERSEARTEAYLTHPGFVSIELDHLYRAIGTNCSIRRAAFLNYGGFDPELRRGEDFELGARLYDGGVQCIFEPRAIGYHTETKDLSEHFRRTCEITGRMNMYRASKKGERNAQTRGLTAVQHRSPLRRLKMYGYWNNPDPLRSLARISREVTDATGSRLSYQVWRRLELATGYWQGVRSEGMTLEGLRQFVGQPLLMLKFRSISLPRDQTERARTLSPQRFLCLMRTLRMLGYCPVSPEKASPPGVTRRSVVLTFDGYEDFYFEVFPHVDRFHLKPLVFLAVDCLGRWSSSNELTGRLARKWLSAEEVREMHRQGVQFGSYGLSHAWLPALTDAELRREVGDSKARLDDLLGCQVRCFAYPGGAVDARVRAAVARAGYEFGFSMRTGLNFWEDQLTLKCIKVSETDTMLDLALKLATGRSIRQEVLGRLTRSQRARLQVPSAPIPGTLK